MIIRVPPARYMIPLPPHCSAGVWGPALQHCIVGSGQCIADFTAESRRGGRTQSHANKPSYSSQSLAAGRGNPRLESLRNAQCSLQAGR